jgi:hypothetical protein
MELVVMSLTYSHYFDDWKHAVIQHAVAITTIDKPGTYTISIKPLQQGKELFKLKRVLLEPIK